MAFIVRLHVHWTSEQINESDGRWCLWPPPRFSAPNIGHETDVNPAELYLASWNQTWPRDVLVYSSREKTVEKQGTYRAVLRC